MRVRFFAYSSVCAFCCGRVYVCKMCENQFSENSFEAFSKNSHWSWSVSACDDAITFAFPVGQPDVRNARGLLLARWLGACKVERTHIIHSHKPHCATCSEITIVIVIVTKQKMCLFALGFVVCVLREYVDVQSEWISYGIHDTVSSALSMRRTFMCLMHNTCL